MLPLLQTCMWYGVYLNSSVSLCKHKHSGGFRYQSHFHYKSLGFSILTVIICWTFWWLLLGFMALQGNSNFNFSCKSAMLNLNFEWISLTWCIKKNEDESSRIRNQFIEKVQFELWFNCSFQVTAWFSECVISFQFARCIKDWFFFFPSSNQF